MCRLDPVRKPANLVFRSANMLLMAILFVSFLAIFMIFSVYVYVYFSVCVCVCVCVLGSNKNLTKVLNGGEYGMGWDDDVYSLNL